jgi:HD-GYP domain-containing protein (c-di-GMP phosphodiesterase class II)
MNIKTEKSAQMIGMAAMFHDIALAQMPTPAIIAEDESKMTPEEKKLYINHPMIGAEMLKNIYGIDQMVIQAISYHHRRKNGGGFPHSAGAGLTMIPLPAEIIGLADEFIKFMHNNKNEAEPIKQMRLKTTVFNQFSQELVDKLNELLDRAKE